MMGINFRSIKTQLILYLACFALFLTIKDRDFTFLFTTLLTVVSALCVETLILYFKSRVFQVTESALITGLIIGYVLSSQEPWWKLVFASTAAILSKHLIRFRGKHIFNPAGFGVFFYLVLLGASTQWRGTYLWYVIAPFGVYFTYKIKKLEVISGYAVISLLLFGTQAISHKVPLLSIFGYFSYFYIFVMVIEPKTTPAKPIGKYLFGAGTAGLIFILTEAGARMDVELASLLIMNAIVPFLNRIPLKKGEAR